MKHLFRMTKAFRKDEAGLATTEYLLLLGFLTTAVILAVIVFGTTMAGHWDDWAIWIDAALNAP